MWLMWLCLHAHIISLWRVSSDGRSFVLMRRRLEVQCPCGPLSFCLTHVPDYSQYRPPVLKMYVYGQKEGKRSWIDFWKYIMTLGIQTLYKVLVGEETHLYLKRRASVILMTCVVCGFLWITFFYILGKHIIKWENVIQNSSEVPFSLSNLTIDIYLHIEGWTFTLQKTHFTESNHRCFWII